MKPFVIGMCCLILATTAAAQDPLTAARDLYASAAYEEALAALTRPEKTASVPTELEDQYRAFCLFALGRTAEAQAVAETLVAKNPQLELDGDASPRIVAMFTAVRKRVLPGLIREKYRAAKVSVDQKDFAAAEPQLETVKRMLEEAARVGAIDEMSVDLRLLVDGFLNLIRTSAADTKPPVAKNALGPVDSSTGPASSVGTSPPVSTGGEVPIYTVESSDVVAPVVLRQDAPGFPARLATGLPLGPKTCVIQVLIDEKGNVERAVVRESIHPVYDDLLMTGAKKWKYRPAIKDNTPVKYLKTVAISVNTQSLIGASRR